MNQLDVDRAPNGADRNPELAPRSTLMIDLEQGTVAAGPWSATFEAGPDDPDEILGRYLALLYVMRGIAPGTPIPLRALDLAVLSQALAMPPPDIEHRLVVLMEPGNGRVARLRSLLNRRVLLGAAGLVVVAATTAGVLVFTPSSSPAEGGSIHIEAPPQVAPPGADDPEIGEGLTIERSDFEASESEATHSDDS